MRKSTVIYFMLMCLIFETIVEGPHSTQGTGGAGDGNSDHDSDDDETDTDGVGGGAGDSEGGGESDGDNLGEDTSGDEAGDGERRQEEYIEAVLKTPDGSDPELTGLTKNSTVGQLKAKAGEAMDVPPNQQIISYNGKELSDDNQTLSFYGVGEKAEFILGGRVRGGD